MFVHLMDRVFDRVIQWLEEEDAELVSLPMHRADLTL